MQGPQRISFREGFAVFAGSLLLLWLLRPCSLNVPYWWDAGAVYAPGSWWLVEHGFAARPGVFPSDLSRGHTHLYYVFTAFFYAALGPAPWVGHLPVWLSSGMVLAYTYALGSLLFSRIAGALASVLLLALPLYLTMSTETLPEIPMTALAIAEFHAFAKGRHREAALWGTLLVLFKETGVAIPLATFGALFLQSLYQRDRTTHLRAMLWSMVPCVVLLAFFLWQKAIEGWFVLPYHQELFHERHSFLEQFLRVARSMFVVDGRWIALLTALGLIAVRSARKEPILFPKEETHEPSRSIVLLAFALAVLAMLVFFTKMFFLERYVLPIHPPITIVIAGVLTSADPKNLAQRWIAPVVVAASFLLGFSQRSVPRGYASGELTFGYLEAVQAHVQLFQTLEARSAPPVILTTWPMTDELRFPWLGWVRRPYRAVSWEWYRTGHREAVDAVVTFEGLGEHRALQEEARRLGMQRTQRSVVGGAAIELWERNSPSPSQP